MIWYENVLIERLPESLERCGLMCNVMIDGQECTSVTQEGVMEAAVDEKWTWFPAIN